MHKNRLFAIGIVLIFFIQSFCGCVQQNDGQVDIPTIIVGDSVTVASENIDNTGGTITVDNTGTFLDGLEIVVPEHAYSQSTSFAISYSPIENHTLGDYFNPISPLINIENGGEYADEIMTVTIPVEIPENHFAMAFYFDENTGELEGIPLVDEDENSITIVTRHFSKITVSSIEIELLFDDIDTGFKHGVDDWQFTNYGSYIALGGHCSGQCIAAMYYYNKLKEKRKTQLYGTYDNDGRVEHKTPKLEYDDEKAYKLCSMLQEEQEWTTDKVWKLYDKQRTDDNDTWSFLAFAYTMLKTGKPQFVAVYKYYANGTIEAGHALIAYRIELDDTTLNPVIYISDPNYPYSEDDKKERSIMFNHSSNKFENYTSPTKAGNPSFNFTHIYYFGVTSFISWETVEWFWEDMEAGTIGKDSFPDYDLEIWSADDKAYIPFTDNYETTEEKVKIRINFKTDLANAELWYYDENAEHVDYGVYDSTFDTLEVEINLTMGSNKIGLCIRGHETNKSKASYIGFDWITINKVVKDLGPQSARIVIFAQFDTATPGEEVYIEGKKITPIGGTKDRLYVKGELFGSTYPYQFDYTLHDPENYILFTAGTTDGRMSKSINVTYDVLANTDYIELYINVK